MHLNRFSIAAATAAIFIGYSQSASAVVSAVSTEAQGNKTILTSVSISDGRVLGANDLANVSLFHYFRTTATTGTSTSLLSPDPAAVVNATPRSVLLEDWALNTGVINPGRAATTNLGIAAGASPTASTPGIGLNFSRPVLNGTGEDVIIIEFAADSAQAADPFVVSGLMGGTGFDAVSSGFAFVTTYENGGAVLSLDSLNQGNPLSSLAHLDTKSAAFNQNFPSPFYRAVAIDLSGVGVPLGGYATGLFIQSQSGTGAEIDPVFIAGFSIIPEPATAGMLLLGAAGLALRRRHA